MSSAGMTLRFGRMTRMRLRLWWPRSVWMRWIVVRHILVNRIFVRCVRVRTVLRALRLARMPGVRFGICGARVCVYVRIRAGSSARRPVFVRIRGVCCNYSRSMELTGFRGCCHGGAALIHRRQHFVVSSRFLKMLRLRRRHWYDALFPLRVVAYLAWPSFHHSHR